MFGCIDMGNDDLFSYMRKCASEKKKVPIRVTSDDVLVIGLSLLINNSDRIVKVLINSQGKDQSKLLDALSNKIIINNVKEFLDDPKREFMVLIDDSKQLKKSDFFEKLKGKIKLHSIPKKTVDDMDVLKRGVNFVIGDDEALIVGSFQYDNPHNEEPTIPTFINFFDVSFNKNLSEYFKDVRDRCLNGGVKYA